MGYLDCDCDPSLSLQTPDVYENEYQEIGTGWNAAVSSFLFFATGALVPILPYIFGLEGLAALVVSLVLVGVALLFTGGVVGLLSGSSPAKRGLRQLAIGIGAAVATYLLGLLFGTSVA
jgi:vacuolar iron transporter family protein